MKKDRRKYVRLNKIFPVELKIVDSENKTVADLLQGFTRDVSFEGLCVEMNNLEDNSVELLQANKAKAHLFLNIPFKKNPIKATANVAWARKIAMPHPKSYLLGMKYESIDKKDQKMIIRYAQISWLIPRAIALTCLVLILFCFYLFGKNTNLMKENKMLVQDLSILSETQSKINQQLDRIEAEKKVVANMLTAEVKEQEKLKQELIKLEEQKIKEEKNKNIEVLEKLTKEKDALNERLLLLTKAKGDIEKKLNNYTKTQSDLKTQLKKVKRKKIVLEDKSLDLMKEWLNSAQSSKTGLVLSYDQDMALMDVGFTYDQALSAFNFINLREYERVKNIFNFYKTRAEKVDGIFANAYDIITGKVSEYITHSGPPIYLGLAMLKYEEQASDNQYRDVVYEIADWLLELQNKNKIGAIPGGPKLDWQGTEQNIAAYVFFDNLFKVTKDQRYDIAKKKILTWIKDYGYNKKLKCFNRGQSDQIIATDTVALSIMAFGVSGLEQMGIDVEELIECIEENCKTKIWIQDPWDKKISVTGYDFGSPFSMGREGTIAVEWTAQMVIAYCELSNHYEAQSDILKAKKYKRNADYYLSELDKLLLVRSSLGKSKSKAGLPYSPKSGTDTGHGWLTPSNQSVSAAGTNFAIFAKEEYNIFRF
ncbi:MAG: PilZ domain-containing protein [Candidatus Omnitrophota bacterium]